MLSLHAKLTEVFVYLNIAVVQLLGRFLEGCKVLTRKIAFFKDLVLF